jgi:putative hydrolase of the HAD superfamily
MIESTIDVIGFDADDTLWHNETLYTLTQERFAALLSPYQDSESVQRKLFETEMRNLRIFGYGVKGFTLSMIETAIELTEGQICGPDIQFIIDYGKEMLASPVRPLEQVQAVLAELSASYRLMLITKGDLFDQETKLARSGLAGYFELVEIVSEKTEKTYKDLLANHRINAEGFLMVGNSLRSDILPIIAIGGHAVHIPYHTTWQHENVEEVEAAGAEYHQLNHVGDLPGLIAILGREKPPNIENRS